MLTKAYFNCWDLLTVCYYAQYPFIYSMALGDSLTFDIFSEVHTAHQLVMRSWAVMLTISIVSISNKFIVRYEAKNLF